MYRRPTPARLWFVRHGESGTNVAFRKAKQAGALKFDTYGLRDADIALTPDGLDQAEALASWFRSMKPLDRPGIVLYSPYVRTIETALRCVYGDGGTRALRPKIFLKEDRFREVCPGVFWGLTKKGIEKYYPREAERYNLEGPFYYRPPGGESWLDVTERVRQALRELGEKYQGERVLVVTHERVILAAEYVLLGWDENKMRSEGAKGIPNASVTSFRFDKGRQLFVPELTSFVPPGVRCAH